MQPKALRPLIDTDILRYRCGFAADSQVTKKYKENNAGASDEEIARHLEDTDYTAFALSNVRTVFDSVLDRFSPEYRAYVQGKDNFRDALATLQPYKGNRQALHKPKYYVEIKDYLIERWNAIEVNGQETDDAIGIEQYSNKDKSTVIVSTDKDMNTIPGWHYNWVKDDLYYVTLRDADLFFFRQMMEGDRVDNILGVKGIGSKTADKIIEACGYDVDRVREEVKKLYQKQYGEAWDKAYWECGSLLYIRRRPNEECPLL